MTASALNIASVAPNAAAGFGQAGSAAGAAPNGAAGGAAGFEALLAALFPQAANMPAPIAAGETAAAAPMLVKGQPLITEAEGDAATDAQPVKTDAAGEAVVVDTTAVDAAAQALAAAANVPAPAPTQPQPQATPPVDAEAPAPQAFGREKPKGAAFQPVAPQRAATAEAADAAVDAADVDGALPDTLNAPAPQRAATNAAPATPAPRAAPAAPAPASAPASAPAAAPAPAPAVVDAAAAPPPPVADAPVEIAQAPAVQTQALAAGQAAPKAEAPAQPIGRPARAERGKATVSETSAREPELSDLAPADKPAATVAKAATAAGKPAAASVEAAVPEAVEGREAQAETPDATPPADTRATTQQAAPAAHAATPVRGSPETVAHLAASIAKKLEGQSTRFDLELNPHGLGKVDVRVEIGASGQMTAAMLFDSPEAAQELKARAAELQRALEQAGFDLSGGLSFDVAGDSGRQGQAWQDQADNTGRAHRGQAFRAALETAGEADIASQGPLRLRRGVTAGLDVRI